MAGTSPAMTLQVRSRRRSIRNSLVANNQRYESLLFLKKKQKVRYAFLFAGLTCIARSVPIEDGEEGCDRPDLLAGARDGGGIFYLNRP
jgi:hypothetical protein